MYSDINNFISGFGRSFIISSFFSYSQELTRGNTEYKIFQGLALFSLLTSTFTPLYLLFAPSILDNIYYGMSVLIALSCYVASTNHSNQIKVNNNQSDKIQRFPLGLHENEILMNLVNLFINYSNYLMFAVYVATISILLYFSPSLYLISSITFLSIDQIYQNGFFDESLSNIYMYFTSIMLVINIFGVSNPFSLAVSSLLTGFTIFDNIMCYIKGYSSSSAQFPVSNSHHHLKLENDENEKFENIISIISDASNETDFYLTFEHLFRSKEIFSRLMQNYKTTGYDKYIALFNSIDFKNKEVKDIIENHLCDHEGFNSKSLEKHKQDLSLSSKSNEYDIKVAYLKGEISLFIDRLNQRKHGDLLANQVANLHGYSNIILSFLKDKQKCSEVQLTNILLRISMETGSHCNRMYLESLGNITSEISVENIHEELTFDEKAILTIQQIREKAFKKYYYKILTDITNDIVSLSGGYNFIDINDYHTYEFFAITYGRNFYLLNSSLNQNFRTIFDIALDACINFAYKQIGERFTDFYNIDYLVENAMDPESKLFNIFSEWATKKNIDILDSYYEFVDTYQNRAYAKLMLLELNVISHNDPEFHSRIGAIEKNESSGVKSNI